MNDVKTFRGQGQGHVVHPSNIGPTTHTNKDIVDRITVTRYSYY